MRYAIPLLLILSGCAAGVLTLSGCAAKTDLTHLGAGVGATWSDGPKIGADASAGKHEVTVAPLFPQAGDAAEGAPGSEACPGGVCPVPGAAPRFCPN